MAEFQKRIEVMLPFDRLRVHRHQERVSLCFDKDGVEVFRMAETLGFGEVWVMSGIEGKVSGALTNE